MFTSETLREVHRRCHDSLIMLIDHCRSFTLDQLNQEHDGFGYPSIRLQLHHIISAENYWLGVLEGRIDADENDPDYPTIDALAAYRVAVYELTDNYLAGATDAELNSARSMQTWGNNTKVLTPAHVFIRMQTHLFQHMGQVTAMCRLSGSPVPSGMDYSHA